MRQENQTTEVVQTAAVSALAAASKTPFKTAFKVTAGIMAAQLLGAILFFGGGILIITAIVFLIGALVK